MRRISKRRWSYLEYVWIPRFRVPRLIDIGLADRRQFEDIDEYGINLRDIGGT